MLNLNYMEKNMGNLRNSYRYERKYVLTNDQYESFKNKILEENFKTHHPSRKVNNIYIDTFSKNSYYENVEGEDKRNKYRLRWYGERFGLISSIFEVKIKEAKVNRKKLIPVPEFNFSSLVKVHSLFESVNKAIEYEDLALFINVINKEPTLLNGYSREYYISYDETIRLTIDREMFYYNFLTNQEYNDVENMIVEIKYDTEKFPEMNFDKLGLHISKNSKYVSGLDFTSI